MIRAQDLKGVVAMMPAFTTPNGDSPDALNTVDTKALTESVDKMIKDGANAIATMGSFGEFHTLLWKEKQTLIEATISAVKPRESVASSFAPDATSMLTAEVPGERHASMRAVCPPSRAALASAPPAMSVFASSSFPSAIARINGVHVDEIPDGALAGSVHA